MGFCEETGQPCAVIGGFAMHAYGRPRATIDLDFAVAIEVQGDLMAFLEAQGYETLHRSMSYSNHLHADPALGRVDFVYTSGETTVRLFADSRETALAGVTVRVPRPEHLVAMKVLAMKNDSTRVARELADITDLLRVPGVDMDEVRRYFAQHGMEARLDQIIRTL